VLIPSESLPQIQALYAYWERKRAGRSMPSRADIQPVEIARLMPHVFIVDVAEDGGLTYRLFGTALVALFGREMTGRPLGDGLAADAADEARARYRLVIRDRKPYFHVARLVEPCNDFSEVERLLLPLSPNDVRIDMVIGIVVPRRADMAQPQPVLCRVSGA
jgi:hypothetical protein